VLGSVKASGRLSGAYSGPSSHVAMATIVVRPGDGAATLKRRLKDQENKRGFDVPVGRVRFYDAEKGFGFLTKDDGGDVYVRASALPAGVTTLKPGQKVEFGVVEGRKGEQALSLRLIETPPSLAKAHRKPPEQMTVIVEDLIKMLDGVGNTYRRGKHPDSRTGTKVAAVLRAVADELEL
jgi:CspA family cold shock protein